MTNALARILDVTANSTGYVLALRRDQAFLALGTYPSADEAMKARRVVLAYIATRDGPDFHIRSKEV